MAQYDAVSKYVVQAHPEDFIRFILEQDNIVVRAVLDTEQPTVEARQADSLIRVQIAGEDALVHTEFQTTDSTNPAMRYRMIDYIGRIIGRYRLPVYSNVIYLRPGAGRSDKGYYVQELPGYEVLVNYKVIRLSEVDGQAIIEEGV